MHYETQHAAIKWGNINKIIAQPLNQPKIQEKYIKYKIWIFRVLTIPTEMKELLAQFKEVFAEPQGMPPIRSHEHGIPLKEGATPFQIRPYKCTYI